MKKSILLNVDARIIQALDWLAKRRGETRSNLIRHILKKYLIEEIPREKAKIENKI